MRTSLSLLMAASALGVAGTASAGIATADANTLFRTDLTQVGYKADFFQTTSPLKVNAWNEEQDFLLTSALKVDKTAAGTYFGGNVATTSPTIASGTRVASHYFYFDPRNSASITTTITFDRKILGIIFLDGTSSSNTGNLFGSDFLIPAGVPMANRASAWFGNRALEGADKIVWTGTNQITLDLDASSPGDQVRVITEAVPEPGTLAALGLGAIALLRRRRKA